MAKRIKKSLCLLLTVTMVAAVFVGCGSSDESAPKVATLKEMDDETPITLAYSYWEDKHIVASLVEGWNAEHPNATINEKMTVDLTQHNQEIINLAASKSVPDVFWVLGSPENMINKGLLYDMSALWEADADTKNIIGGINDFKLGYFGTAGKWTTPVKFFPTVMFLNLTTFEKNNYDMPDTDWTWEDFEKVVKDMSHDKYFGISEACTVITFYPIASDPNCQGEFGWDGKEFDLTNWADGMELEAEFVSKNWKAPVDADEIEALYGDAIQPQDEGYVAIRSDQWWCWERFWNDSSFYSKQTFFVPYVMPHTEDNQDSTNMFATMDFGAISSTSENKLAAYYLLKYMTWGADGWNWKLDHYQEIREKAIIENGGDPTQFEMALADDTTGGETINNCPITLDEEVWDKYMLLHPNTDNPDPIKDKLEAANVSERGIYFDAFWEKVKAGKWTCYGSQQIPGFDTFLQDYYFTHEFLAGFEGIEAAVIEGNFSPHEAVADLTNKANENAQDYKEILDGMLKK